MKLILALFSLLSLVAAQQCGEDIHHTYAFKSHVYSNDKFFVISAKYEASCDSMIDSEDGEEIINYHGVVSDAKFFLKGGESYYEDPDSEEVADEEAPAPVEEINQAFSFSIKKNEITSVHTTNDPSSTVLAILIDIAELFAVPKINGVHKVRTILGSHTQEDKVSLIEGGYKVRSVFTEKSIISWNERKPILNVPIFTLFPEAFVSETITTLDMNWVIESANKIEDMLVKSAGASGVDDDEEKSEQAIEQDDKMERAMRTTVRSSLTRIDSETPTQAEAIRQQRSEADFSEGKHPEDLGKVLMELRNEEEKPKWIERANHAIERLQHIIKDNTIANDNATRNIYRHRMNQIMSALRFAPEITLPILKTHLESNYENSDKSVFVNSLIRLLSQSGVAVAEEYVVEYVLASDNVEYKRTVLFGLATSFTNEELIARLVPCPIVDRILAILLAHMDDVEIHEEIVLAYGVVAVRGTTPEESLTVIRDLMHHSLNSESDQAMLYIYALGNAHTFPLEWLDTAREHSNEKVAKAANKVHTEHEEKYKERRARYAFDLHKYPSHWVQSKSGSVGSTKYAGASYELTGFAGTNMNCVTPPASLNYKIFGKIYAALHAFGKTYTLIHGEIDYWREGNPAGGNTAFLDILNGKRWRYALPHFVCDASERVVWQQNIMGFSIGFGFNVIVISLEFRVSFSFDAKLSLQWSVCDQAGNPELAARLKPFGSLTFSGGGSGSIGPLKGGLEVAINVGLALVPEFVISPRTCDVCLRLKFEKSITAKVRGWYQKWFFGWGSKKYKDFWTQPLAKDVGNLFEACKKLTTRPAPATTNPWGGGAWAGGAGWRRSIDENPGITYDNDNTDIIVDEAPKGYESDCQIEDGMFNLGNGLIITQKARAYSANHMHLQEGVAAESMWEGTSPPRYQNIYQIGIHVYSDNKDAPNKLIVTTPTMANVPGINIMAVDNVEVIDQPAENQLVLRFPRMIQSSKHHYFTMIAADVPSCWGVASRKYDSSEYDEPIGFGCVNDEACECLHEDEIPECWGDSSADVGVCHCNRVGYY